MTRKRVAVAGASGYAGGELTGLAVRQGEEHDVVPGERVEVGLLEHPIGQRQEVRLERAELLAGVGGSRQRADLDVRVGEQMAQELASGVPAGAGDSDPQRHMHNHALPC